MVQLVKFSGNHVRRGGDSRFHALPDPSNCTTVKSLWTGALQSTLA